MPSSSVPAVPPAPRRACGRGWRPHRVYVLDHHPKRYGWLERFVPSRKETIFIVAASDLSLLDSYTNLRCYRSTRFNASLSIDRSCLTLCAKKRHLEGNWGAIVITPLALPEYRRKVSRANDRLVSGSFGHVARSTNKFNERTRVCRKILACRRIGRSSLRAADVTDKKRLESAGGPTCSH